MSSSAIRSRLGLPAIFLLVLLLRFLSLFPAIIDDDEAWFSASAAALRNPVSYFQQALDNKPPGTAWFYWCAQHLIDPLHGASSPRFARFLFCLGIALAALLIGRIARKIQGSREAGWLAAILVLAVSGLPFPKLFAVTNEGLMLPLIAGAVLAVIRAKEHPKRGVKVSLFLASGACLAGTTLIKQTGIFFFLPVLAATGAGIEACLVIAAFCAVLSASVFLLGSQDFIYWVLIYPAKNLTQAREKLFSSWADGMMNLGWFGATLIPVLASIAWKQSRNRVLWAWLLAALASIGLGRGLFLHYFLLLVPPLCILVVLSSEQILWNRWRKLWLALGYSLSCILIATPISGIFWGTDLPYYSHLSERIRQFTKADEKVFVWGGNAMPLAMAGRVSNTRFVMARMITPPYATDETLHAFENDFSASPPALVIDLHERGDNQFNFPIDIYPWFKNQLDSRYSEWRDPSLPWARFYLLRSQEPLDLAKRGGLCPAGPARKMEGLDARKLISKLFSKNGYAADLIFRSWYSLYFLTESCPQESVDMNALSSLLAEAAPGADAAVKAAQEVMELYHERGHAPPFPLESRSWWVSLSLVTMQPVAMPR